ncbi:hypothetical protein [Shewanella phage vB_SbaS_Y11]|nr:hypothetical protein [Shewanella phage vB_SbaS_Y11]
MTDKIEQTVNTLAALCNKHFDKTGDTDEAMIAVVLREEPNNEGNHTLQMSAVGNTNAMVNASVEMMAHVIGAATEDSSIEVSAIISAKIMANLTRKIAERMKDNHQAQGQAPASETIH